MFHLIQYRRSLRAADLRIIAARESAAREIRVPTGARAPQRAVVAARTADLDAPRTLERHAA